MTSKVTFDRSYWPAKPISLDDILAEHPDEAEIFVAESLINDPPTMTVHVDGEDAEIQVFLWSVGGDTVAVTEPLVELIEETEGYGEIISEEQAEDVKKRLANLEKLENAIQNVKDRLNKELTVYQNNKPPDRGG